MTGQVQPPAMAAWNAQMQAVARFEPDMPDALADALFLAQTDVAEPTPEGQSPDGYRYVRADDMVRAAREAMHPHGLFLTLGGVRFEAAADLGTAVVRDVTLRLTSAPNRPACAHAFRDAIRFPIQKGPRLSADKATAAAMTSSLAYFLRDLLQINRLMAGDEIEQRQDEPAGKTAEADEPERISVIEKARRAGKNSGPGTSGKRPPWAKVEPPAPDPDALERMSEDLGARLDELADAPTNAGAAPPTAAVAQNTSGPASGNSMPPDASPAQETSLAGPLASTALPDAADTGLPSGGVTSPAPTGAPERQSPPPHLEAPVGAPCPSPYVCEAAKVDGIVCPPDSCDIEDGVRGVVSVDVPTRLLARGRLTVPDEEREATGEDALVPVPFVGPSGGPSKLPGWSHTVCTIGVDVDDEDEDCDLCGERCGGGDRIRCSMVGSGIAHAACVLDVAEGRDPRPQPEVLLCVATGGSHHRCDSQPASMWVSFNGGRAESRAYCARGLKELQKLARENGESVQATVSDPDDDAKLDADGPPGPHEPLDPDLADLGEADHQRALAEETVAPGSPASSALALEAWWVSWSKGRRSLKRAAKAVTRCCACHEPILAKTGQMERGTIERMHEACWLSARNGVDPRRAKPVGSGAA